MCVDGLLPIDDDLADSDGYFLTFVVPVPSGCNLKCGFCFIRQRSSNIHKTLLTQHYSEFIYGVQSTRPIAVIAIQGYEPLLPGSQSYTRLILETGTAIGVPVNLVTNGTYLSEAASWLATAEPANIAISLDAASADANDRIRGVAGAWRLTVKGIERATKLLTPRTRLAVTSVLMRNESGALEGMPALLRSLGIERWIITPLLKVGQARPGGPAADKDTLYKSLAKLQDAADAADIDLSVDDELDCLGHKHACIAKPELSRFHVRVIPPGVELIRLDPGGEFAVGREVLRKITEATPRWYPERELAVEFLERMAEKTLQFQRRLLRPLVVT